MNNPIKDCIIESFFLPPITYVAEIIPFNTIWINHSENFQKQTLRNRAYIKTAQGIHTLSVPVHRTQNMRFTEITIDHSQRWSEILIRTIQTAYNKSAFYEFYKEEFEKIILTKHPYLHELNAALLSFCIKALKLPSATHYYNGLTTLSNQEIVDLRNRHLPNGKHIVLSAIKPRPYYQVFGPEFVADLSIIDLLFNKGTNSLKYLYQFTNQNQ